MAKTIAHHSAATPTFDVERIRADFPILSRTVGDKPLVYLDSAATSQKPQQVIDAEADFYAKHNANAHRGIHMLGRSRRSSSRRPAARSRGSSTLPRPRASCSRAEPPSR